MILTENKNLENQVYKFFYFLDPLLALHDNNGDNKDILSLGIAVGLWDSESQSILSDSLSL